MFQALSVAWLFVLALPPRLAAAEDDSFCDVENREYAELGEDEIKVALRTVEGSNAKEGCAVGWIAAPAAAIFQVLEAADTHAEFMPHVKLSEVEPVAEGVFLNRQILELPFPLRNRHYTVRLVASTPDAAASAGATGSGGAPIWSLSWTLAEPGNLKENVGGWTLLPVEEDRTLVAYRVFSDPGGMVPKWALNTATRKTLPSLLQALEQRVQELSRGDRASGVATGERP